MVITSQSIFLSRFNLAVKQRSRTFQVPANKFILSILSIMVSEGYVLSYFIYNDKFCLVFPNHKAIDFMLKQISKPSRPIYFNYKNFSKSKNSGSRFIIQSTSGNIYFSEFFKFSRINGRVLYSLSAF